MAPDEDADTVDLLDLALPFAQHWKALIAGPLLAGMLALGLSYLVPPTYTSRTVFLPPQQQQSAAASAIAQLGALSGLAGAAAGVKNPADQYVALLESTTVADRLIDEFKLIQVYDVSYRFEARKVLAGNVRITLGKRDGLISVEVDDLSAQRAADIANRHVDELKRLTSQLALSEAQQRRAFFEVQLKQTRDQLTRAQQALQASGFNQGALKADARAAAESDLPRHPRCPAARRGVRLSGSGSPQWHPPRAGAGRGHRRSTPTRHDQAAARRRAAQSSHPGRPHRPAASPASMTSARRRDSTA